MALDTQQAAFVNNTRITFQKLAEAMETLDDLKSIYYDRQYGIGGANEIRDADLTDQFADITAANLAAGITATEQLLKYRDNEAVTTGDYGTTINILRSL